MAVHLHRGRDRGCLALTRWRARSESAQDDPSLPVPVCDLSDVKPASQPKNDEHEHDQAGR
jgi:hypothetical protein